MIRRKRIKRAQFREAKFFVEADETTGGRRVVTHEFPFSESFRTADFGRKPKQWNLLGFLFGPMYKEDRRKLEKAFDEKGPGDLDHPYIGGKKTVHCLSYRFGQYNRELGFIQFNATFQESGEESLKIGFIGPSVEPSLLDRILGSAESIGNFLADSSNAIDAFSEKLEDTLAPILSIRQSTAFLTSSVSGVKDVFREAILEPSRLTSALTGLVATLTSMPISTWQLIRAFDFSIDAIFVPFRGGSDGSTLDGEILVPTPANEALGAMMLTTSALLLANAKDGSYSERISAHQTVLDRCNDFIALAQNPELVSIAYDLRDQIIESQNKIRIARHVVRADTNSILLSYQLTGGLEAEEELLRRNSIFNPVFIPSGTTVEIDV